MLGPKIGEGATSDVHAWAPGQVVKLFKSGIPQHVGDHEIRMMRALSGAGCRAPDVVDVVVVDGRRGIVMSRLDGPSLMDATKAKALSFADAGAVLAACLQAVHATTPPSDVPRLRDAVARGLRRAGAALPEAVANGVLARIDRLEPGDGLCHGDPNPGNVILAADGPILIDWIAAMRAPAAFDLASAHVLLTELAPHIADDPGRPRAVNAALQAAYADAINVAPDALAAQVAPYLPIVRALALVGGAVPALAPILVRRLRADFPG